MPKVETSKLGRLWRRMTAPFVILSPVWIVKRHGLLTVIDYRPTFVMLLSSVGFVTMSIAFLLLLFPYRQSDSFGLWFVGTAAVVCFVLLFRGTIRESYHFEKKTGSYTFVRQFIHRREVIEGPLSQFTGATVITESEHRTIKHFVVLRQQGLFRTGAEEQRLREKAPSLNFECIELRIAKAINSFVRPRRKKKAV